ncbi:MAG: helix-turn-helix domain-containing protein [Anaerolineales bacterium]
MSDSIGQRLRAAREGKGCSLEDVERITRIRARHLAALEADEFAALPSESHAKGFLRNYAEFLGLEAAPLLARYAEARSKKLFPRLPSGRPSKTQPPPSDGNSLTPKASPLPPPRPAPGATMGRAPQVRSRRLRWLSPDVWVAAIVTVLLVGLMLWGGEQMLAGSATATPPASAPGVTPSAALASGVTQILRTVTATATPFVEEATPTLDLPTPLASYIGVNLSVRAEQRAWVRVVVDGAEAFAGLLAPGEIKDFAGRDVIEVVTGNGLGTRVIWNGRDQGTLGELGEVVVRQWTLEGMVIPTPTITPTPTETPRVTPTP